MTTALLVIDVQASLCTGEFAAFDIERVLSTINASIARARAAGIPVVFVQHEQDSDALFRFGSPGWQLAASLTAEAEDERVRKTTPDSFNQTHLHAWLQARDIKRLLVCGLQSEFCVDTSVRRALSLGYEVVLLADGHSTLDNDVLSAAQISAHHNAVFSNMTSYGPRIHVQAAADVVF
ncbi:cysteine hydrolase family protein [Pseudomonas sp. zfem002]|uniref:cysteine hydrolase family protein n=1 Tax=Pseudomonas sp. zfem002 TaxID=3078197 RepID=UPI00292961DA|nr:cysteine hydrolase family protein [Pseudomonas sp. zfem002]MDU9394504.1 cysteine hydrolase family protein [Pseudomonas sp. zfem002]